MSGGMVALKNRLTGARRGSAVTITRRTSGRKPMSSMRSDLVEDEDLHLVRELDVAAGSDQVEQAARAWPRGCPRRAASAFT